MPLPPELADRFAVVEDLSSGVEADVAVVEGIDDGSRRVLKLYREGFSPDEKAVDRLVRADDWTHVVKIFEVGWSWGGERFYEILEYCEQGSLRSLLVEGGRPALNDVVGQLAAALEFVHGPDVHVVHRDLKPENLFLRTLSPLELALGDFGVVRSVDGSVRWTMGWGTPEYAPPEFEGGEVSAAWDWWSLGMIAAELAVGRHLFALPDGTMPDPRQIRSSLAQRPVDLSEVADARVRLLCQGLLTRDRRPAGEDHKSPSGSRAALLRRERPGEHHIRASSDRPVRRHRARLAQRAGPVVPTTLGRGAAPPLPRPRPDPR